MSTWKQVFTKIGKLLGIEVSPAAPDEWFRLCIESRHDVWFDFAITRDVPERSEPTTLPDTELSPVNLYEAWDGVFEERHGEKPDVKN